jgi:hypothetical protein
LPYPSGTNLNLWLSGQGFGKLNGLKNHWKENLKAKYQIVKTHLNNSPLIG